MSISTDVLVDLGGDVFSIDTMMAGYSGIAAGYLIRSSRPCLVETGAANSAPLVVSALERAGLGPNDLATIVVTHIHLDHAGGVGDLAAAFPRAQVVVQERGARHLVDPTKLLASARRVFGDDLDTLFGPLLATPAERLTSIAEVGKIDLGDGRELAAFHAPGHATHHLGLIDSVTGDLYTGDAAGIYVPETADVRPATPPPDFDLDLAVSSMERFRAANPNRLLFSHFGPVTTVAETLDRSIEELRRWVSDVRTARALTPNVDHAVAMVRERTAERYAAFEANTDVAEKFEHLSSTAANVHGIWRWLEQTEPVEPE
jgi:glyoxylase-like metal-dependent hydrolase (beta-lactamase superfamily II)